MPDRTAILIVNGFDQKGRWGEFDPADALRYPWIELCLREVERRSRGSEYGVFVWDNTNMGELRDVIRRHGASLHPTDEQIAKGERTSYGHGGSLQRLLELVDDSFTYVMTLDTDAFPIRDGWIEELKGQLANAELTGVWRDEMGGYLRPFVHPSCLFIRRERLMRIEAPFAFAGAQDVGQRITQAIEAAGEPVAPLRRTNARNAHFLVGGIYGDLVYHHGAGSRAPVFRESEGQERDVVAYEKLRDALFADADLTIAILRGVTADTLNLESTIPRAAMKTSGWLDGLSDSLDGQRAILKSLMAATESDERFRAMQVQGSVGRGEGDALSDIDVGFIVANESWPSVCEAIPALLRRAGQPVDEYYNFVPSPAQPQLFKGWAQFEGGIQLDLMLVPGWQVLGSGPDGRNLFDRDGRLVRTDHPMRLSEPEEIRKWAFLAWQNLTEVLKYLSRGRLIAATEWLNSARQATISCWAAAHGVEYAGFANVASARLGVSVRIPAGWDDAYAKPDRDSILAAAVVIARVQREADAILQTNLGIGARPLARWVTERLTALDATAPARNPAAASSPQERSRRAGRR